VNTKKSLRQKTLSLLSAQNPKERDQKSRQIQKKLFKETAFCKAKVVCFYVALPMEVNTHPMIEDALRVGKKVLVPLVDLENKELKLYEIRNFAKDLAAGTLGILEPVHSQARLADVKEVDLVIVPGLAFDKSGNRLGRGAGFYDRFLSQFSAKIPKIALAFSFQVVPQIPHETHDQRVDKVLTED